ASSITTSDGRGACSFVSVCTTATRTDHSGSCKAVTSPSTSFFCSGRRTFDFMPKRVNSLAKRSSGASIFCISCNLQCTKKISLRCITTYRHVLQSVVLSLLQLRKHLAQVRNATMNLYPDRCPLLL